MFGGAQMKSTLNLAFKNCNAMCAGESLFKNLAATMASDLVKQMLLMLGDIESERVLMLHHAVRRKL